MSTPPPLIIGVGGTLRDGSTSQCALRSAFARAEQPGASAGMFARPAFDQQCDPSPYLSGRAVGLVVCADVFQATGSAPTTLRAIVDAPCGWPTPFAATLKYARRPLDSSGACHRAETQNQVHCVVEQAV
jgi:FMN reductase